MITDTLTTELMDRSPSKAGGLACLTSGAYGAALLVKCRYLEGQGHVLRLERLAEADGASFAAYLEARRSGLDTSLSLQGATNVPLRGAELCLELLEALPRAYQSCPKSMFADLTVGARLLLGCLHSCVDLAEANLALFTTRRSKGEQRARSLRSKARQVSRDLASLRALHTCRTVAVIGLSENPDKPAYYVPAYLEEQGYRILGVHPRGTSRLAESTRPRLQDHTVPVDLVLLFRRSEKVSEHLADILATKPAPRVVWMQQGIQNPLVAEELEDKGFQVVSDRCARREHQRLMTSHHTQNGKRLEDRG